MNKLQIAIQEVLNEGQSESLDEGKEKSLPVLDKMSKKYKFTKNSKNGINVYAISGGRLFGAAEDLAGSFDDFDDMLDTGLE